MMGEAGEFLLALGTKVKINFNDRRAAFQAVAPQTDAGLYLVPKVIE